MDGSAPGSSHDSVPSDAENWSEEDCKKALYQGEILLLRYRYQEAVDKLELCVKNMDRIYGEGSDALGEAYLCYGQALLGVEQMDESLFQKGEVNGMEEAAEEEDDDDEDEDDEEEGEGEAQDQDEDEGKEEVADGEKIVNGDAAAAEEPEKVTNGDSTEESKEPNGEEVTTDSPAPGPSGVQNTDEAEEQITNMQVAWEVTEMARNIFLARSGDDPDNLKKLGRAYATLAEIAGISRQFVESAADFQRALEILQKTQNSLREQAEILYLRSNALVSCNRFDEAVEALRGAMDLLTKHQDDLKEGSHPDRTEEDIKKEIDEISELKAQLSEKFGEIEIAREDINKLKEQKEKLAKVAAEGSSKSPTKPTSSGSGEPTENGTEKAAKDISHLIRRKEKRPDVASANEGPDPKKRRTDDAAESVPESS